MRGIRFTETNTQEHIEGLTNNLLQVSDEQEQGHRFRADRYKLAAGWHFLRLMGDRNEARKSITKGYAETIESRVMPMDNEDWLRYRVWDMYRLGKLITELPDLLWALNVENGTTTEQLDAVEHFVHLPVWNAAPETLKVQVAKFLKD